MTAQPARDQLRALAESALAHGTFHGEVASAVPQLLDQLDAVEAERNLLRDQLRHMIDSWHSLDEQVARADQAEARIKAVEDVLDAWDRSEHHDLLEVGIRRALDG